VRAEARAEAKAKKSEILRACADLLSRPAGGERMLEFDAEGNASMRRATAEELLAVVGQRGRIAGLAEKELAAQAQYLEGKARSDAAKAAKAGPVPKLAAAAWRASGLFGAGCFLKGEIHPKLRGLLLKSGVDASRTKDGRIRFSMKKPDHEWSVKVSSLKSDYFARNGRRAQESDSQ
jgi:hypothetical protein